MPAKGKYLLNDQELKNEALYRKFSSQYQPLVLLLGLSMLFCGILLILFIAFRLVSLHIQMFVSNCEKLFDWLIDFKLVIALFILIYLAYKWKYVRVP